MRNATDVYVDDVLMKTDIDLGCSRIEKDIEGTANTAVFPVYAAQDLPHGQSYDQLWQKCFNSYVIIDAFLVLDGSEGGYPFYHRQRIQPSGAFLGRLYKASGAGREFGYTGKVYVKME